MFIYYHRIREHHGKAVISLAVLTNTNPAYRPAHFEELVAGSGVSFRFRAVKLLDYRDRMDELLASDNPFALLIAAQLTARLVRDGKQRADSLIAFYRLAIRKQLSREEIVRLRDLSDELRQRLTQANEADLDRWAERILFANSLDEVFG